MSDPSETVVVPPKAASEAFSGMKLCLIEVMKHLGHSVSWEDHREGYNVCSTVFIDGQEECRCLGPTRASAHDEASYHVLTKIYIPILYPPDEFPYKYMHMTWQLHDELARIGQSSTISWEPDTTQGDDYIATVLIKGQPSGMGIGPTILCARDMAAYYALKELDTLFP